MQNSTLNILSFIVTYLVFGGIGYPLAQYFKMPVAVGTWFAIVVSIVVLGFSSLGETWLLGIGGFQLYLLNVLHAVVIGLLIGLIVREWKARRSRSQTS